MAMASASSSSSRRLTKEQRLFIVEKYHESGKKISEVMKAWGTKFVGDKCPARGSIDKLIKKFEETGSVETKQPKYGWRKKFSAIGTPSHVKLSSAYACVSLMVM